MGRLQTCLKCRALLEPGTRTCPYCETSQRAALAPSEDQDADATSRLGSWLLLLIAVVYVLTVVVDPAKAVKQTGPMEPSNVSLWLWGSAVPALIRAGEVWRLVASMFLHADLRHLAFNGLAIFLIVPIAARTFGLDRSVCVYIWGGLCGSLLGLLTRDGTTGSVGASGAVCAAIAALAVYRKRRGGHKGDELLRRMGVWALIIVVIGYFTPRVDNMGHIGGFIGGAIVGYLASGVRIRGGRADTYWRAASIAAFVVVAVVFALFVVPGVWSAAQQGAGGA